MSRLVVVTAALVCLLLLPAVEAKPPADAFCVILFEGQQDFDRVLVLVDLETNLTERQALFNQTDLDGDGAVDLEEQERFRVGTVRVLGNESALGIEALSMAAGDGALQWGARFHYATVWTQVGHTFHKQDHTTPLNITDPADLETQEVREYRFEHSGEPLSVHVSGGVDPNAPPPPQPTVTETSTPTPPQGTPVPEYVVVRAGDGWTVQFITGSTYEGEMGSSFNQAEVDLPAFDTKKPFTLRFEKTSLPSEENRTTSPDAATVRDTGHDDPDGRFTAGVPAASVLLATVALAAALRRRL